MLKIRFKNKKYSAVWLVEPQVNIGRARDNELVVSAPDVAAKHLTIKVDREQLELVNLVPDSAVLVNDRPLKKRQPLVAKDVININGVELEIIDPKNDTTTASERQATNPRTPKTTGWALKANHSALQNRVYPLKVNNVVGRSSDCDISLSAAHLSRRHAELTVLEGVLYVKDLGSANGTYLNGKPVTEARVKRGDELRLDTLSFGVIGPADDMAKTTVRSMDAKPGGAAVKKPARPVRPSVQPAVQPAPEPEKPRYGAAGLAVLAVLTAVVVIALYVTRG